jgi:hypothetical protein
MDRKITSFRDDISFGDKASIIIKNKLEKEIENLDKLKYPYTYEWKRDDNEEKDYDYILKISDKNKTKEMKIEFKTDNWTAKTGNMCFEIIRAIQGINLESKKIKVHEIEKRKNILKHIESGKGISNHFDVTKGDIFWAYLIFDKTSGNHELLFFRGSDLYKIFQKHYMESDWSVTISQSNGRTWNTISALIEEQKWWKNTVSFTEMIKEKMIEGYKAKRAKVKFKTIIIG